MCQSRLFLSGSACLPYLAYQNSHPWSPQPFSSQRRSTCTSCAARSTHRKWPACYERPASTNLPSGPCTSLCIQTLAGAPKPVRVHTKYGVRYTYRAVHCLSRDPGCMPLTKLQPKRHFGCPFCKKSRQ